jgi:hypothetical protein
MRNGERLAEIRRLSRSAPTVSSWPIMPKSSVRPSARSAAAARSSLRRAGVSFASGRTDKMELRSAISASS